MSDTTTATANAGATSAPTQQNGPSGTASSLYLYTFLATLVLLLGVSAAIVLRSMALRVRHRRMIEEAIRNGTYIPPSQRPAIQASDIPKIYDIYIDEGDVEKWDQVLPVAAAVIPPNKLDNTASGATSNTPAPRNSNRMGLIYTLGREFRSYYFPRRVPDASASNEDLEANAQLQERQLTPLKEGGEVGVTVLIAMPSQHHNHDHSNGRGHGHHHNATSSSTASSMDEKKDPHMFGFGYSSTDQGLPHLEFGLVKLPVVPVSGVLSSNTSPNPADTSDISGNGTGSV